MYVLGFLGITMDKQLTWKEQEHIHLIANKISVEVCLYYILFNCGEDHSSIFARISRLTFQSITQDPLI